MNSGFCFAANEEANEKQVVITDSHDGEVVLVPVIGNSVRHLRARVASVKKICDAITAGKGVEMPSLSNTEISDILKNIVADPRINNVVKDFLLPDLKEASDSERK